MPTTIHVKEIMIDGWTQQLNVKHIGSRNPRHPLVDVADDVGVDVADDVDAGAKKLIIRSQNVYYSMQ